MIGDRLKNFILRGHSAPYVVSYIILSGFAFLQVAQASSFSAPPQTPVCHAQHQVNHDPLFENNASPQALTATLHSSDSYDAPEEIYAKKLYQRLTGVPAAPRSPQFRRMVRLIKKGNHVGAAEMALNSPHFYSVRLRNLVAPWTNAEGSPQAPFDDLQALFMGIVRDKLDARLLLTADFRYEAYPGISLPKVSRSNNLHYTNFETKGLSHRDDLTQSKPQWKDLSEAAGALTTRAWAASYYGDTNRRAVKFAVQIFACAPIESWRLRSVPDFFVRRDIPRAVSGNVSTYQNDCRGCHSIMDGLGGAFARFDFKDDSLTYTKNQINPNVNRNPEAYPEGYLHLNDFWVNYLIENPTLKLGWRGPVEGVGLRSFAQSLASSRAFSQCMVKRVFKEICGRTVTNKNVLNRLTDHFEDHGRLFDSLFVQVATDRHCLAH